MRIILGLIIFASLSLPAWAEITGLQDVCNRPDVLAKLPQYMKDACANLIQLKLTYTPTNDGHLIVEGTDHGQQFRDVYDYPPGSWYSAQGRKVIVHPPDSQ